MSIRNWPLAVTLIAGLAGAAACGGGNAKPPLTPESGDSPTASETSDAGASASSGGDAGEGTAGSDGDGGKSAPAAEGDKPKDEGAQTVLKQFVSDGADHATLTKALRPTTADYKALFDGATAAKVEKEQNKDWDSGKAVIKPKAGQTEVKLWSATGADIAGGKGDAKEFPDGYKKVGKHLAKDAVFYRFKFVEPGKDTGTAYDGLTFVNSHWVIVPKPWRALDGKAAKDEPEEAAPKPSGKKKPKAPKPKKK